MAVSKTRRGGRPAKAKLAGQCLTILRRRAGARNIASPDGDLTTLVLLAIIARGAPVTEARKVLNYVKESFVDWNELRVTRPSQTAFYLGKIKQAREKARTICDVLGNIFEGTHDLALHFLEGASAEEARDFLTGLGGLPESMVIEIILSGRRYFHMSADTDVTRAARRLGLIGRNTTPGGYERDVVEMLGEARGYQLTFLLKEHSEAFCTVHSPGCDECALVKICSGARPKTTGH